MEAKKKIIDIIRSKNTQLPTLPVVVDKILSLAKSDRSSSQDVASIVEKDQAISSKLLRLANSAYYGFMKEVDSISRAITIVGLNEVIGLTIGMNVFSAFGKKDTHGIFDLKSLWLHSIACATVARDIAKKKQTGNIDKIFLIALLHDMGKVIFAKYLPDEYRGLYEDAINNRTPLYRKEKESMGIDHAELSGLLMKRWGFPNDLLQACRYHHNSGQCPPSTQLFATIVELADYMCQKAKMGHGGNGFVPDLTKMKQRLRMSSIEMEFIVDELKQQRSNIEEFLDVIG